MPAARSDIVHLATADRKKAVVMGAPEVFHHVGLLDIAPASTHWFAPYCVIRQLQRGFGSHNASPPHMILSLARENARSSQSWWQPPCTKTKMGRMTDYDQRSVAVVYRQLGRHGGGPPNDPSCCSGITIPLSRLAGIRRKKIAVTWTARHSSIIAGPLGLVCVRIVFSRLQDAMGGFPNWPSNAPRHLVFANFALGHEAAFRFMVLIIRHHLPYVLRPECIRPE